MKIAIQNIGRKVTVNSLAAVFSTYGNVQSAHIIGDGNDQLLTGRTAHVFMPDDEEAAMAIEQLDGCFVDGCRLSMAPAAPPKTSVFFPFINACTHLFHQGKNVIYLKKKP